MTKSPNRQSKQLLPIYALLRFCGSMQLAMILMAVIIVAATAGTLLESGFNANVAQAYVYDAPWFYTWLFLLCVNLIAAVLVKYPWQPHQYGFIIVHGGIVVMLVGGIIGRILGVEGYIHLTEEGSPQNYLVTGETLFQVKQPDHSAESFSLPLNLRNPSHGRPFQFNAGRLKIDVLDVTHELGIRQIVESSNNGGEPALRLVVSGEAAPHPIDRMLVMNNTEHGILRLGANSIRFGGASVEHSGATQAVIVSRERHFAFARLQGANMARVMEGKRSNAAVKYEFDPEQSDAPAGTLLITIDDSIFNFAVDELAKNTLPLADTGWSLHNVQYFPDFRMQNGQAVNYSDKPANPTVIFELLGPVVEMEYDDCCPTEMAAAQPTPPPQAQAHTEGVDCCPPEAGTHASIGLAAITGTSGSHPVSGSHQHGELAKGKLLKIGLEDGQLVYESNTFDGIHRGVITVGESFSPGWEEWDFRVEELIESAVLREELAPITGAKMTGTGASGLLIRLDNGKEQTEQWIRMGSMTMIPLGTQMIHVGFGFRLHPLDFSVNLERFEVEFNPGTQTPASFKSHVTFRSADGDTLSRAVWMNNPANFPNFPGAGLLGTSYKFSQSSWNPGDLGQTTLQVIRDPGWALKWIGSLLFCLGLLMVFYLKPYPQFQYAKTKAQSAFKASAKQEINIKEPVLS